MRDKLVDWIRTIYAGRMIKISGGPYLEHLEAVAEMAAPIIPLGFEIGLCHDLLEDTGITADRLQATLIAFDYSIQDAIYITQTVKELTDHYSAVAYPSLKKRDRKEKEDERLMTISGNAQTVKYGDLIYNINWTKRYQPKKAKAYLQRKRDLLSRLDQGDKHLRELALTLANGLQIIDHNGF